MSYVTCMECWQDGKRQVVRQRGGAWICPVHRDTGHIHIKTPDEVPPQSGRPITPDEVEERKTESIPPIMFEIFNDLIAQNWSNGRATVKLSDASQAVNERAPFSASEAFDKKWFDVEGAYREAGWNVVFDKPGYNESYSAYYIFTRGKK